MPDHHYHDHNHYCHYHHSHHKYHHYHCITNHHYCLYYHFNHYIWRQIQKKANVKMTTTTIITTTLSITTISAPTILIKTNIFITILLNTTITHVIPTATITSSSILTNDHYNHYPLLLPVQFPFCHNYIDSSSHWYILKRGDLKNFENKERHLSAREKLRGSAVKKELTG